MLYQKMIKSVHKQLFDCHFHFLCGLEIQVGRHHMILFKYLNMKKKFKLLCDLIVISICNQCILLKSLVYVQKGSVMYFQITIFRMGEGAQDIDLAVLTALLKGR